MTSLYLVSAERNDAFEQDQMHSKEAAELERRLSKPNKRGKPETDRKMQDRMHWCLEQAHPLLQSKVACYWNVVITDRQDRDSLKRDRKRYREVFRAIETSMARGVELLVARTFNQLVNQYEELRGDLGREALAYPAPLSRARHLGRLAEIGEAAFSAFNPAPIDERGHERHWPPPAGHS